MSSKDNDEERVMHSKNDNIKVMINNKTDEVIEKLFQSLLSRNEIGLRTPWKIVISYFIVFIRDIRNVIKQIVNVADHM